MIDKKSVDQFTHLVNSTIEETRDMQSHLYSFYFVLENRLNADDELDVRDKAHFAKKRTAARLLTVWQSTGFVSQEVIADHLTEARTVNATIQLGRDIVDFVEVYAEDAGLNPEQVMAEAIKDWHETHSSRKRRKEQLKGVRTSSEVTPHIEAQQTIANQRNKGAGE